MRESQRQRTIDKCNTHAGEVDVGLKNKRTIDLTGLLADNLDWCALHPALADEAGLHHVLRSVQDKLVAVPDSFFLQSRAAKCSAQAQHSAA